MEKSLEETGKKITDNLKKALFKINNDASVDDIKAAKSLLAEADYQIEQYEAQTGNHSDISRTAKSLSREMSFKIAKHPSEQKNYA
jgi:hypothetical protein